MKQDNYKKNYNKDGANKNKKQEHRKNNFVEGVNYKKIKKAERLAKSQKKKNQKHSHFDDDDWYE